jgi:hypothetical protein
MGRPWEYPRWRRVLMQVVMWLVFAGSLGLATVLARNRNVERTNVVRVGVFELRVPDEFKIDASGRDTDLLAHDEERSRRLRIQTLPLDGLEGSISPRGEQIKFRTLGTTGGLDVQRRIIRSDEGEARFLQLRATAAVQRAKRIVVITLDDFSLDMRNEDDIRKEDENLITYLAADLSIVGKAGRNTTTQSAPDDSDL